MSDETHAAITVKTQAAKSRKGRGRGNAKKMERDGVKGGEEERSRRQRSLEGWRKMIERGRGVQKLARERRR